MTASIVSSQKLNMAGDQNSAGAVINSRLPPGESAISLSYIRLAGPTAADAKLLDAGAIYIPFEIKCVNYQGSPAEFRCCR